VGQPGVAPPVVVTLTSIENVTGTEHADIILGDKQPNRLSGGGRGVGSPVDPDSDLISGRRGSDRLDGGGGHDRLYGGGGSDEIHGQRGTDLVSGQRGNDRLYGERGRDDLQGGSGDDRLGGGGGYNRNDGGSGIDTCRHPRYGLHALRCER
jgi:Ca2+-binding RTX toxin-like protein